MDADFVKQITQSNIKNGTLQFDASEFDRKPQGDSIVPDELLNQVKDAVVKLATTGMWKYVSQVTCIAAQFKNTAMRGSSAEPKDIEAALTKLIDTNGLDGLIPGKLSYSNQGCVFSAPGTRSFVYSKE
eukprot:CAMPEP_0201476330 /NCGR_PEP_ID=MMETSP0151_2-20130828/1557_1 /ASSEMBLY_ACC=CAM_ASM_000257 /TAXON_ID=200890 /ORGANISM="Paramoeba atlantica, Strain 621/1 / CCAP 1560/9" /LENGTH=128 /DNA_ID=CAMNT_0047856661 /DNA_START=48 /DNA_END=434 /DNA_ORIENTATION=+